VQVNLFSVFRDTGPQPAVNCIGGFNDGRSAAWAGATLAGCPYGDPLLATAWACGWRAGLAEQGARYGRY